MIITAICFAILFGYNVMALSYCGKLLPYRMPRFFVLGVVPFLGTIALLGLIYLGVLLPIAYVCLLGVLFTGIRVCFYGKTIQVFWAALNFAFHVLVIRGMMVAIFSLVMNMNMYRIIENKDLNVAALMTSILVMIMFLAVFQKKINIENMKVFLGNARQFRFIYIIQLVMFAFLLFCTYAYYYNLDLVWFTIFHFLTCLFLLVGFYITLGQAVRTAIWIEDELNYQMENTQMQRQLKGYKEQKKLTEMMKRYRHDYQNTLCTLNSLLKNDKIGEAQELLGEMSEYVEVELAQRKEYSNIVIVDIILAELAETCEQENITMSAQCFISESVPMTALQMSRVFNNIASNALEACRKQPEDCYRWIEIVGSVQEGKSVISARNSYSGKVIVGPNSEILTTKENPEFHGLGIKNYRTIVEKCGGLSKIEIKKTPAVFEVLIVFPLDSGGSVSQ